MMPWPFEPFDVGRGRTRRAPEMFARFGRKPCPFALAVVRGEQGCCGPETPQQRLERDATERGGPRECGPREDLIGQRHAGQYRQGAARAPAPESAGT